jgi:hypothetical protein
LSPSARSEALKLPLEVAQNVASRVVARAVRWVLSAEDDDGVGGGPSARSRGDASAAPTAASSSL